MTYSKEELAQLNYKEIRKLCKQVGVKANKKHVELVNDLADYFFKEENELKELEKEMEQYDTIDLNATFTLDEDDTEENKKENDNVNKENVLPVEEENENTNDTLLKATLMKEVERRAEEKLSKIPRFVVDNVVIPNVTPAQPNTPEVTKKTNNSIKMDSIDQYLEKKKKRAVEHLKVADNYKENSKPVIRTIPSLSIKKSARKSVRIDTTFEFNPKLKSTPGINETTTRVSPRLAAFKDANHRPKPILNASKIATNNASDKSAEKKKNKRVTLSGISVNRKSDARKSTSQKPEARKSFSAYNSPFISKPTTPQAKTPIKFDLQESLKKTLSYKPHTGKLKAHYFSQESTSAGVPRKTKVEREDRKVSVKTMTKNLTTRDRRRTEAASKRDKSRLVVLDKRRGIVG